jgi:predicted ester cyclase
MEFYESTQGGTDMDIKEFGEKFIKAQTEGWLQGKTDGFDELEDPDVVYHFLPPNPDRVGLEGHKKFLEDLHKAFTDTQMQWKYLTGEGNLFAVSYSARAKFTGELPGFPPPTRKEITVNEMFLCRLEKGKIVEAWGAGSITNVS